MKLANLLPRPLAPQTGSETVTLLNALFARTHLDRRLARRIGWRGMRPSFSHGPAWTARAANARAVYGLAFLEEAAADGLITARYALYVFPDPESPAFGALPPEAQALAAASDFRDRIRELSAHADDFRSFIAGEIELGVSFAGDGLELTLSARRSRTRTLPDGSSEPTLAAFRLCAPFFALLSQSLDAALEEQGELSLYAEPVPAEVVCEGDSSMSGGPWLADDSARRELLISETAAFGRFRGLLPGRRMKRLLFRHRPSGEEARSLPVIHVLTGFLGAGKTTFLKAWLSHLNGRERYTGVIQNEFGEADLDSLVLKGETRVEALDDGCVCCTLADSLRPGIERLIEATPAEQFVLETTGVADPMNVMYELLALNDLVERGLLITIVDAYDLTARAGLAPGNPDAAVRMRQILNADVLVCAKADAVEEQALEALMQTLHELNPDALVMPAFHGEVPFAALDRYYWHQLDAAEETSRSLLSAGPTSRAKPVLPSRSTPRRVEEAGGRESQSGLFGSSSCRSWRRAAEGAVQDGGAPSAFGYDTFTLAVSGEASLDELRRAVRGAGPGLVRCKGIVSVAGVGPCVIQYASGVLGYEPAESATLEAWHRAFGGGDNRQETGFLVFIGRRIQMPEHVFKGASRLRQRTAANAAADERKGASPGCAAKISGPGGKEKCKDACGRDEPDCAASEESTERSDSS